MHKKPNEINKFIESTFSVFSLLFSVSNILLKIKEHIYTRVKTIRNIITV